MTDGVLARRKCASERSSGRGRVGAHAVPRVPRAPMFLTYPAFVRCVRRRVRRTAPSPPTTAATRYLPRPGHVGPGHGHIRLCPMIISAACARGDRARACARVSSACAHHAPPPAAHGRGQCSGGRHWWLRGRMVRPGQSLVWARMPQGVTGVRLSSCLVYSTGCLPVPYPCWVWSGTRDGGCACAGLPERVV
jgi:hypothetical protein